MKNNLYSNILAELKEDNYLFQIERTSSTPKVSVITV